MEWSKKAKGGSDRTERSAEVCGGRWKWKWRWKWNNNNHNNNNNNG